LEIREDDLTGPEIAALLQAHLTLMRSTSPEESAHALDIEGLRQPNITFWSVWDDGQLLGCGALKELDPMHGEIKSMHTTAACRGRGIAGKLLRHILDVAMSRGYRRVSLETGSTDHFLPARNLYAKHGFVTTGPFAGYGPDPHSAFMTLQLP
jgi:putative acetyltransferase